MPKVEQPYYLKKSIKIFRFYGIGLLISMFTVSLLRSVNENFKVVYEALVAIPYLITLVLAPLGLYTGKGFANTILLTKYHQNLTLTMKTNLLLLFNFGHQDIKVNPYSKKLTLTPNIVKATLFGIRQKVGDLFNYISVD